MTARVLGLPALLAAALAAPASAEPGVAVRGGSVVAGPVRVQVITPTLLRLEHAPGGRFEDRPSFTVAVRRPAPPPFTARRAGRELRVRTSALLLRHRLGSRPFGAANTTVRLLGERRTVRPRFGDPPRADALGGWYRGLDHYRGRAGPVDRLALHPGLLHRGGWFLLDDSDTALRAPGGWVQARPRRGRDHQDGYFFGYGTDYAQGLADLRLLTGPAVLLPRWAFGVWYSRYFPHRARDYRRRVLPAFRAHRVPLDVLVVDTDWKAPDRWAGWSWSPARFPDPESFLAWAARERLRVVLNVHPAIPESDPRFPEAQALAGGGLAPAAISHAADARRFDWGDPAQARAWAALHAPFERQGVAQWWLDFCCEDSGVGTAGLTADSWVNELYRRQGDARGLRGFVLSRIGASFPGYRTPGPSGPWAEHRSTIHFTGDTRSNWATLAFAAAMTPAEGSIGLPYVSHDIGGFGRRHLPGDLYLRWVQLGAFQPILRLHSDHGDRLPWQYGPAVRDAAAGFLRLRESLVPYLYATARAAHDTGLPMARALYLHWPRRAAAYRHPTQYMLGDALLVAPVTGPGLATTQKLWIPPGTWTNLFTGATERGPRERRVAVTARAVPVYAKAGAILPQAPAAPNADSQPADALTLTVFPHSSGRTSLYDDAGEGLGHRAGAFARTPVRYTERRAGGCRGARATLTVGPVRGGYPGRPRRRAYTVVFAEVTRPCTVRVNGRPAAFAYRRAARRLVVRVSAGRGRVTIAHDARAR